MKETKYPRSFSHIGITVPDVKKSSKILFGCYGLVYNYGAIYC